MQLNWLASAPKAADIAAAMTFDEAMQTLEQLGTEQNRKIYKRHGAGENIFGVSFANQYALQKKIKCDQALSDKLWATGNADARILSLLIAAPAQFDLKKLHQRLSGLNYYTLVDMLVSNVAAKAPCAREALKAWMASDDEWIGSAGYGLLSVLLVEGAPFGDEELLGILAFIEANIHKAKNRTRHAMNMALISIGGRNEALKEKAIAAAKRIGKVVVDHGETNCKTPEAVGYIDKMWAHKERMDSKAKPAKKAKTASKNG